MEKKIRIACKGATALDLEEFTEFQGELKSLSKEDYEKLRRQIQTKGFSFAVHVWKNKGKNFILDGHQRLRTVQKMVEEGWKCPAIPVVFVEASSLKEAKQKLLSAAAQYGKTERQGLYEFLHESGLVAEDLTDIRFPEVDLALFKAEFFTDLDQRVEDLKGEWVGMPEFDQQNKTGFRHLIVHFVDEAGAKKFFELIGQEDTGETKTIWFPPQERMDTESKRYVDLPQD